MEKHVVNGLGRWLVNDAKDTDVVLSSRIRLARNIEGFAFAPTLTDTEKVTELLNNIEQVVAADILAPSGVYNFYYMRDITDVDRKILVEKHLVSPMLDANYQNTALVLRGDEALAVMVNEEDHLRIQCLRSGLALKEAWQAADQVDDLLESQLTYTYDEKLGYLTSCVTNTGTGLRASAMLHIPALVTTGHLNQLITGIQRLGMVVRGYYGEGSEAEGNLYQVSNQRTLGYSEPEIIETMHDILRQIVEHEREARKFLLVNAREKIENRVWRSLGILIYGRSISFKEAMRRLSDIRLGIDLGLLQGAAPLIYHELLALSGTASIMKQKHISQAEVNKQRALLLRERLQKEKWS